jgi:formate dehydrogenase major subunit
MAECHPVAFRSVMEAKKRGATVIHVDPRFTRTSAVADAYVPIRAGTDIVLLGALVRHVIEHERYFREYVVHYTNAPTLLRADFQDTDELDGLFSGYDPETGKYEIDSWQYEGTTAVPASGHKELPADARPAGSPTGPPTPLRDETLQHERCVFQVLRRHFARYTPEMVERVCGIPQESFEHIARALCDNSGRERTSAICYSVGWTQHTVGVQYIRAAAILQLLLGNVGRPGGGLMALRGHASIQGSTDIPTLFELLPGYMPMPTAEQGRDLEKYLQANRSPTRGWSELPKYMVSLLKAWYGEQATRDNQWRFGWLPPVTGEHSHMATTSDMAQGKLEGYLVLGENPVVGSVNGRVQRQALRKLKWLVVRDLALTETAEFWRNSPEIDRGEMLPEDIDTEVFFFPAAAHTEKSGSYTNTQRLLQWHHEAVRPPGDARSDLWFMYELGRRLKELYAGSPDPKDEPLLALTWEASTADAVLREINGCTVIDGKPISSFLELEDDGSTASGCWIYAGCYADGVNQTARRKPRTEQNRVSAEWGWAWPANRRLLYNRASADPQGRPWSERKRYVWWDEAKRKWTGLDVPDFVPDLPPDHRPPPDAQGMAALAGDDPFVLQADGKGWLYAPAGLLDGPLPTHYEPHESVSGNALYGQQCNPVRLQWKRRHNPVTRKLTDRRFPYVLTTFRLTEHHTAGGMSRQLPWLSELQPEMFCEISTALARDKGVVTGDWVTLRSPRAEIGCRVLVTERIAPLQIDGRTVHQVAVPWHFGRVGLVTGASANELLALVGDPNSHIQESKVTVVDLLKGRPPGLRVPGPPREEEERDLPGVGQRGEAP